MADGLGRCPSGSLPRMDDGQEAEWPCSRATRSRQGSLRTSSTPPPLLPAADRDRQGDRVTLPPDPLAIWLPEEMRDPGRVRISEVGPQWREVLPGLECRLIPEDASEPVLELRRALPGMPTHAVVEIEWAEDGADRRQKFGPWTVTPDESYAVLVSGFICGWSRGKGVEPGRCTLTTGDESIAEGAVSPWRDERGGPE